VKNNSVEAKGLQAVACRQLFWRPTVCAGDGQAQWSASGFAGGTPRISLGGGGFCDGPVNGTGGCGGWVDCAVSLGFWPGSFVI